MADAHKNFAYSLVATAPSPAATGTSLVVTSGQGTRFPTVPFNATIWPASTQPTSTNSEIVRVTAISTDTLTITRAQEGTQARTVIVGDQIAASITTKTLTDAEGNMSTWSPFILASQGGTGLQTLNDNSRSTGTGSLFVFPITVPQNLAINQILVVNSLTFSTGAAAAVSHSYYSKFGLYTMNANTLSLISSNSFSIGETLASASMTWNYPTSTATSGYGYGNLPAGSLTAAGQISSALTGSKAVGLQFGANMYLTPNIYYLGLLSLRSTAISSSLGLSHAGIFGQAINTINQAGSAAGLMPIGVASSDWTSKNTHLTGWWGRHIVGFITATSIGNFGGTAIPSAITLSELGAVAAASTATILPMVTLMST